MGQDLDATIELHEFVFGERFRVGLVGTNDRKGRTVVVCAEVFLAQLARDSTPSSSGVICVS